MRESSQKVYSYKKGNPFVLQLVPADAKFILDVGCGAGDNGEVLSNTGYIVDGITISEEELAVARKVMRNVFIHELETGLPVLDQKYDVVILSHVLEHIRYPDQLLKDIHSVLSPTGILIVALPNLMHFRSRWKLIKGNFEYEEYGIWDYTHFRWYTFRSAKKLLQENGYSIIKAEVSGEIPFESRLKKIIPASFRKGIYNTLKKISPGLFGFQLLYVARSER